MDEARPVATVAEGRVIFNNVRKVTDFLVSPGAVAIVAILYSLAAGIALPRPRSGRAETGWTRRPRGRVGDRPVGPVTAISCGQRSVR